MYNKLLSVATILILLVTTFAASQALSVNNMEELEEIEIKVAIYDSPIFRSPKNMNKALNYSWNIDDIKYTFKTTFISDKEIMGIGKNKLTNDNYDVLIIGAESRQFLINQKMLFPNDREYLGLNSDRWINNIKEFIANGGGYVGHCGGANIASQGLLIKPDKASIFDILSLRIKHLGVANIYVNDQQTEEWQYAWKIPLGNKETHVGVPIDLSVNQSHAIFNGYPYSLRNVLWFAGPSLLIGDAKDEMLGDIVPLAYYTEEPMEKAPLHMWRFNKPFYNIKTDINGQMAGIATVYNDSGRIVLFGPHSEYGTFTGGNFTEFRGFPRFPFYDNYYYTWVDVNPTPDDYNYWIFRRSVAWVTYIPDEALPPIEYIDW